MRPSSAALAVASLLACAHARTPQQDAMMKRGDCAELLVAADGARAAGQPELARDLASACPQPKLDALIEGIGPEQALLWCGRARAATDKPACNPARVAGWIASLHPHLTVGPPEPSEVVDPLLAAALAEAGAELNLRWDPEDPDVMIGKLTVSVEHLTSRTVALAPDARGAKQRVDAVQHRFVAHAEAQADIGGKTRVVRAIEEARDATWDAAPKLAVAAKFSPEVPGEAELRKRAAVAWLRALGKALSAAPPENVDVDDVRGCVAYGLSLNLISGDPSAAAAGNGDHSKVAACEKLLGEPAGAGIPVP